MHQLAGDRAPGPESEGRLGAGRGNGGVRSSSMDIPQESTAHCAPSFLLFFFYVKYLGGSPKASPFSVMVASIQLHAYISVYLIISLFLSLEFLLVFYYHK